MFAREGYLIILVSLLLAVVLTGVGLFVSGPVQAGLLLVGWLSFAFTLYFFRDPARLVPEAAALGDLVLAPADGKVVVVQDIDEPLYIQGPARQISIFLSPLNVHVNRVPADGVVEYERYVPGAYLVAWHPKASEKNERSEIGVRHPWGGRILFKQIAGAVARRIAYDLKVGQEVKAGQRFGIVKFGSRMDVLLMPEATVEVTVGQKVTAGITVIARMPAPASA